MTTMILPENWRRRIERELLTLPFISFGKIVLTIEISCGNSPGMMKVKRFIEEDVRLEKETREEEIVTQ